MKYITIIALLWISFQVSGQSISKSGLVGCWTASGEENTPGSNVFIYRPCDYKVFPPSRYRFKMILNSGSKCSWLVFASNDGHYMQDGTWTFSEETDELNLYDMEGKEVSRFIIVWVDDKILKMKDGAQHATTSQ